MLAWREAMSTGNPDIDKAQKQVIAHMNEFETALGTLGANAAIGIFLTGLYEQVSTNFRREEQLQRECGFPFLDAHRHEHESLLSRLAEIQNLYQALPDTADHQPLLRDLAALIRDWVSRHMIQSDVMLRRYGHAGKSPQARAWS